MSRRRAVPTEPHAALEMKQGPAMTVISLFGEVDLDVCDQLRLAARRAARRNLPVAVDLSHVTFIESTALALLARMEISERLHDRTLSLVGVSPQLRKGLHIAGLDRLISAGS